MNDVRAAANTDRELWRETPDDYYSPSIHVTATGGIGINVGGTVVVMTAREWHRLSATPDAAGPDLERLAEWLREEARLEGEDADRCRKFGMVDDERKATERRCNLAAALDAHAAAAVAKERERCAAIADRAAITHGYGAEHWAATGNVQRVAAMIRATPSP